MLPCLYFSITLKVEWENERYVTMYCINTIYEICHICISNWKYILRIRYVIWNRDSNRILDRWYKTNTIKLCQICVKTVTNQIYTTLDKPFATKRRWLKFTQCCHAFMIFTQVHYNWYHVTSITYLRRKVFDIV